MDNEFGRRSLLAPATAAAAFGLGSRGKLQAAEEPVSSDLLDLARLRDCQTRRSGSYDRTGATISSA